MTWTIGREQSLRRMWAAGRTLHDAAMELGESQSVIAAKSNAMGLRFSGARMVRADGQG